MGSRVAYFFLGLAVDAFFFTFGRTSHEGIAIARGFCVGIAFGGLNRLRCASIVAADLVIILRAIDFLDGAIIAFEKRNAIGIAGVGRAFGRFGVDLGSTSIVAADLVIIQRAIDFFDGAIVTFEERNAVGIASVSCAFGFGVDLGSTSIVAADLVIIQRAIDFFDGAIVAFKERNAVGIADVGCACGVNRLFGFLDACIIATDLT